MKSIFDVGTQTAGSRILLIAKNIHEKLNSRIDEVSQDVIIAQIELLLSYASRFYKRQFITGKAVNSDFGEIFIIDLPDIPVV